MAPKQGGNRGNAGKGRPKGAKNKTTQAIKDAVVQAFEKLGGVNSLVTWGQENPTEFFKLWGRMAPQEVQGSVAGSLTIRVVKE